MNIGVLLTAWCSKLGTFAFLLKNKPGALFRRAREGKHVYGWMMFCEGTKVIWVYAAVPVIGSAREPAPCLMRRSEEGPDEGAALFKEVL